LINDPLITYLETELATTLGGKPIFELYSQKGKSSKTTPFQSKLNITLLVPEDWEVVKDNYSGHKKIGSFRIKHRYFRLNDIHIIKNKTSAQIQTYVNSIKQELELLTEQILKSAH
jgi:hypothetical protein